VQLQSALDVSALKGENESDYLEMEDWIYDFLLRALEEYHKHPGSEMRGILNQVDILLMDKDLPDQAEKLIARGRKLGKKERLIDSLMEISEMETALLAIKPPSDELIKKNGTHL
jgi:hypothetical protein